MERRTVHGQEKILPHGLTFPLADRIVPGSQQFEAVDELPNEPNLHCKPNEPRYGKPNEPPPSGG